MRNLNLLLLFIILILSAFGCASLNKSLPPPMMEHKSASTKPQISFKDIQDKAKALSESSYVEPNEKDLPEFLSNMGYDQWWDMRYEPGKRLWRNDNLKFQIQFVHRGFIFKKRVDFNVVDETGVHPFTFSKDNFDYGKSNFGDQVPADLGYSGFKINYIEGEKDKEAVVFLGASYFRAVGLKQHYGISSRGIAVNTALPEGEEFPLFKEFWLVKPNSGDQHLKVYALLDSASLTGAYEFIIKPGIETQIDVSATLYLRKKIKKLGIAPLTSMFVRAEYTWWNTQSDFRPELHDSDGLYMVSGQGEETWRPLINPTRLFVNVFKMNTVKEFSFLQRDNQFDHYQDLEARYDNRPCLRIEPHNNWQTGKIELVQIPTPGEFNDNMVAYWVFDQIAAPEVPLHLSYVMTWFRFDGKKMKNGYVSSTRLQLQPDQSTIKFFLEFEGESLKNLRDDLLMDAEINVSNNYAVRGRHIQKNIMTGGYRLVFEIVPPKEPLIKPPANEKPATELRVFLKNNSERITEIWTYGIP